MEFVLGSLRAILNVQISLQMYLMQLVARLLFVWCFALDLCCLWCSRFVVGGLCCFVAWLLGSVVCFWYVRCSGTTRRERSMS